MSRSPTINGKGIRRPVRPSLSYWREQKTTSGHADHQSLTSCFNDGLRDLLYSVDFENALHLSEKPV